MALIAYHSSLRLFGERQSLAHIILTLVLCLYFLAVLALTGVCIRGEFTPNVVFIPGASMLRGPVEALLNVLLFVPLGMLLPLLYEASTTSAGLPLRPFSSPSPSRSPRCSALARQT